MVLLAKYKRYGLYQSVSSLPAKKGEKLVTKYHRRETKKKNGVSVERERRKGEEKRKEKKKKKKKKKSHACLLEEFFMLLPLSRRAGKRNQTSDSFILQQI